MRQSLLLICGLLLINSYLLSQNSKELDKKYIKEFCGCFSVTFDFAEFFPSDTNYKLHSPYHTTANAEWIFVDEEQDDKLVIQHLLIVRDTVIKHWRQDWIYENTDFHFYFKDKHWKYVSLPKNEVKGQWTQKVYEVDDSPRYQGTASWIHIDGKHYWENTSDTPLPRREYTKRKDYNVLRRTNRQIITSNGWIHDQDNIKIIRNDEGLDSVLVYEKGINRYKRIDDSYCKKAKEWWEQNKNFWRQVRNQWNTVLSTQHDLVLKPFINNQMLYEAMFDLNKKTIKNNFTKDLFTKEIVGIINNYKD